MVPSTKKILEDLDELVKTNQGVVERCKAVVNDPSRSPADRRDAGHVARDALDQARAYAGLAEQLREGVIDRSHPAFREMYRRLDQ